MQLLTMQLGLEVRLIVMASRGIALGAKMFCKPHRLPTSPRTPSDAGTPWEEHGEGHEHKHDRSQPKERHHQSDALLAGCVVSHSPDEEHNHQDDDNEDEESFSDEHGYLLKEGDSLTPPVYRATSQPLTMNQPQEGWHALSSPESSAL